MNKTLKFVWKELVYGGHLISLGAVSIVVTSAILLNIPITWDFLLLVYLITYTIYLYDRFKGYKKDLLTNYDRSKHIEKYIKYIPVIIFGSTLIIIGILFYFSNLLSLILGMLILLSGLCYSLFFKKITQKIIGFKSFYVSFVWALLVIFLAFYYLFPLNLSVFFIFAFVFLRCLIGTNFSDIKDIDEDKKEELLTMVIVFGGKRFIKFLNIINALSIIVIATGVYLRLLPVFSLMLILTFFYSLYYFNKTKNRDISSSFLYNVFVDGEHIPWLFFILIGKFLLC